MNKGKMSEKIKAEIDKLFEENKENQEEINELYKFSIKRRRDLISDPKLLLSLIKTSEGILSTLNLAKKLKNVSTISMMEILIATLVMLERENIIKILK